MSVPSRRIAFSRSAPPELLPRPGHRVLSRAGCTFAQPSTIRKGLRSRLRNCANVHIVDVPRGDRRSVVVRFDGVVTYWKKKRQEEDEPQAAET